MALQPGWADLVGNVPPVGTDGACSLCHGVANDGWATCYKCKHRWSPQPGFDRVRLVVPCSVAVGDSDWYRALYTYKAGSFDAYAEVLSSVLSTWLNSNGRHVIAALCRRPDAITVVPSKRVDHPTSLWEVAHGLPAMRPKLSRLLSYTAGAGPPVSRDSVISDRFKVLEDVTNRAIILIEDTWVSGQTAVAAALALAEAGAAGVAIIAIARMVYPDTLSATYEAAIRPPYVATWPK